MDHIHDQRWSEAANTGKPLEINAAKWKRKQCMMFVYGRLKETCDRYWSGG